MTTSELNELADRVHQLAKDKGWHSFQETDEEFITRAINNAHGEVSELWEAFRSGTFSSPCDKSQKMRDAGIEPLTCVEEECADIVIRDLDSCERLGIAIPTSFGTWPCGTVQEGVRELHGAIGVLDEYFMETWAHESLLARVDGMAKLLNFDLWSAVERKHQYNATREYRHGGKVA